MTLNYISFDRLMTMDQSVAQWGRSCALWRSAKKTYLGLSKCFVLLLYIAKTWSKRLLEYLSKTNFKYLPYSFDFLRIFYFNALWTLRPSSFWSTFINGIVKGSPYEPKYKRLNYFRKWLSPGSMRKPRLLIWLFNILMLLAVDYDVVQHKSRFKVDLVGGLFSRFSF